MVVRWSETDEKDLEPAILEAPGLTLKEKCKAIDGWRGRTWQALESKANKLGIDKTIKAGSQNSNLDDVETQILDIIKTSKTTSAGEISRKIDRSKETVKAAIASLHEKGYDVDYEEETRQVKFDPHEKRHLDPIKLSILKGDVLKFGLISDTHFGSKYQSLSLVQMAYDLFAQNDCYFALHAGDIVDGIRMYKGHESELFLHGMDEQQDYVVEHYPKAEFKTFLVSGNHDLSFKKTSGANICRRIAQEREDIVYRGDCATDFIFRDRYRFHMIHPDGGVAYARSYRPQKIVESIINEAVAEARNYFSEAALERFPVATGIGHYHVAGWFPLAGLNAFMIPTTQRQTPYLKGKALSPDMGVFIVTIAFDKKDKSFKMIPEYYPMGHYAREGDW